MTFTFYYEDGNDNIFNDNKTKVYDPMEGVLTDVTDSNIVLETITSRYTYLKLKPSDSTNNKKTSVRFVATEPKVQYNNYDDSLREKCIGVMIESGRQKGIAAKVGKELEVNECVA